MTDGDEGPAVLVLSFHEGEYLGDAATVRYLFDIAGGVARYDTPPLDTLEEARLLLEMYCKRYSSPRATGSNITVFVGREKIDEGVEPLARLDIVLLDGKAWASIMRSNYPCEDVGPVRVDKDDDVGTIACKLLGAKGEAQ
ncbi:MULTISPECIES: hypothetical protein [Paraburkholderia]|uniref:Uncharacterized protein n=1 Tax=Paraburkholderia podalyriae TaxID=1938811 RepID=A0ABR7PQS4_9BURK|nr:hypothetical protein [Paraburkholderia podalyriae]MBC8748580.1 hypothetical protein [Paraburkholderia podalyriae]